MSKRGHMSEDRVRFFLHFRYYQQMGMNNVLCRAFGMDLDTVQELRRANDGGFWIVCRPSQFARFMIYRDAAGINNGFKDLNAVLTEPCKPATIAEALSAEFGQSTGFFCAVLKHVGVNGHDPASHSCQPADEVQVWANPRQD